jgi:hypothetical protein
MEEIERVLKPECRELYSKLWDNIKKAAAIEVAIPVVSSRTGVGAEIIRSAISRSRFEIVEKTEKLVNELLECDC